MGHRNGHIIFAFILVPTNSYLPSEPIMQFSEVAEFSILGLNLVHTTEKLISEQIWAC